MALLSEAMREKELDVRMVGRGLGKGQIFAADMLKHEDKLEDDGANAEHINLDVVLESIRGKSGLR
jgi:hypothetical protein